MLIHVSGSSNSFERSVFILSAMFEDFMHWQLNLASKLVSLHFTVKSCFNNELAAPGSGTCFLTHC